MLKRDKEKWRGRDYDNNREKEMKIAIVPCNEQSVFYHRYKRLALLLITQVTSTYYSARAREKERERKEDPFT